MQGRPCGRAAIITRLADLPHSRCRSVCSTTQRHVFGPRFLADFVSRWCPNVSLLLQAAAECRPRGPCASVKHPVKHPVKAEAHFD